jgi:ABC-type sugar transport system substrate-binding protein
VKKNLMKNTFLCSQVLTMVSALALFCGISTAAIAAGPQVVSGPGADADCMKPWSSDTKYLKWPKKDGPYRIALVNGFIGNTWRIQMIKTAKAYAEKSDVKSQLKSLRWSPPVKISPPKSLLRITSLTLAMTL